MSILDDSTSIKRHEGKRHNATVVILARKRIKVLFAMMKTVNSITTRSGSASERASLSTPP